MRPMLEVYTPLLESRLDELKIVYSTKGKEFTRSIENHLHYSGTKSSIPIEEIHSYVESTPRVTLINRGRAKSEGFALNKLAMLSNLNGELVRLVKVGVFPRRERVTRFGRINGWQWIETGLILLDSKIIFVKGDISGLKILEDLQHMDEQTIIPPLGTEIIFELSGSIAFYDSSIIGPTDYSLRLVSPSGESDILSFQQKDILNHWIGLINYLASIQSALSPVEDNSPTLIRRRAGTMAPPAGRPIPLRAVSSTLELRNRSKSEQIPLPPSSSDKLSIYTLFQKDMETKLHLQKIAVDSLLRQARGLLIQTPIQERTRLGVLNALERVTKRLKISRIEMERGLAYIDVLSQITKILGIRTIRIVRDEMEEFQLPRLGFVDHKKTASDETVDTMLSSTTLYTTLNPTEDIGIPVRKIGIPMKSPTKIARDIPTIPEIRRPENSLQLEKCESAPEIMDNRKRIPEAPLAEDIPLSISPRALRVAEISREAGF
jgi:hypothetical protein